MGGCTTDSDSKPPVGTEEGKTVCRHHRGDLPLKPLIKKKMPPFRTRDSLEFDGTGEEGNGYGQGRKRKKPNRRRESQGCEEVGGVRLPRSRVDRFSRLLRPSWTPQKEVHPTSPTPVLGAHSKGGYIRDETCVSIDRDTSWGPGEERSRLGDLRTDGERSGDQPRLTLTS